MKIGMASDDSFSLAGHAGQARRWLVFNCQPKNELPEPQVIELTKNEVFHYWQDDSSLRGHPLDGLEIIVARSAGDSFLARMQKRGVQVLLTAEVDAKTALQKILAGEALPDKRWDVSQLLCKLRDLFGSH